MTIGIAAICHDHGEPRIAVCSDLLVTTDKAGAETTFKLESLAPQAIGVLHAGNTIESRELTGLYRYADIPPLDDISPPDLQDQLRQPLRTRKRRMIETLTQSRIGLSYEEFLERSEQIEAPVRARLADDIERLVIDVELLLFGFGVGGQTHPFWQSTMSQCPFIYKVVNEEVYSYGDFACIGVGADAAEQTLFRRKQHPITSVEETLYNLYEAKRFSEQTPLVGKDSVLAVMEPPTATRPAPGLRGVTRKGQTFLRACYRKYGPREIKKQLAAPPDMLAPLKP